MKRSTAVVLTCALFASVGFAADEPENARLDALTKKLEEMNSKIDALSQQILKIEQQLDHINRPGVMIGEPTPPASAPAGESGKTTPQSGNTHIIAKGETLTSIAKQYKVSVDELQKVNHIENDRKLQVGQTITIPTPSTTPSPSVSAAPNAP